jgi:hypothetical protein
MHLVLATPAGKTNLNVTLTQRDVRVPLWATAHPTHHGISRNAPLHGPILKFIKIYRIGQLQHGIVRRLTEPCPPQHVNYVLPGVLHDAPPSRACDRPLTEILRTCQHAATSRPPLAEDA